MDLSIIIVNYRGWDKLRECLDSLSSIRNTTFSFEVLVADNNSADGVIGEFISRYPAFRFIRNDLNGGFAYGCNSGAGQSSGRKLLFLNPDTVAGEDALSSLYRHAAENERCIISCSQKDEKGRTGKAYGQFLAPGKLSGTGRAIASLFTGEKETANPMRPDWVSGSVIMISREFFFGIGGFDEDFWMYYEDMDICRRARDAGGDVLYFTDFSIVHKHGGSSRLNLGTTALTKTEVLISRHLYVSKHFAPFTAFLCQAWMAAGNILTGVLFSLVSVPLFRVPGVYVRALIFLKLMAYYLDSAKYRTWISRRSVKWAEIAKQVK